MPRIKILYEIPRHINRLAGNTYLHLSGRIALLRYDYFIDGVPHRSGIRFDGVLTSCTYTENYPPYYAREDMLREIINSDWLNQMRDKAAKKGYSDELLGAHHYVIALEDSGAYEFIALDYEILPEETGEWK